jgi:hypothetical protein
MNRRIISKSYLDNDITFKNLLAGDNVTALPLDTYYDRLIKYIPADVVAGWITAKGIISSVSTATTEKVYWMCFAVGLIFTFFWTYKLTKVEGHKPAWIQILIATIAFVIWVLATGKPFNLEPYIGSLILLGYTLGIGLIIPKQ